MMPFALIDCASSSSLSSSNCIRGCSSFGVRRSMSTSSAPLATTGAASGISALSPLPSAGRLSTGIPSESRALRRVARQQLLRQRYVRRGAARLRVIQHPGNAMTGRLAQLHIPRNDRVEHLLPEELADVACHELAEIGALVIHRQ